MHKVEICLSPLLIDLFDLKGKNIVVIDVLRATSTMIWALHNGAKEVITTSSLEKTLSYSGEEFITAGERNGKKLEGLDYGNSPNAFEKEVIQGKTLVLTTTNGTKTIDLCLEGEKIFAGSFINLSALANHLKTLDNDILIVCSGWKGRVNAEDTLFAGALLDKLMPQYLPFDDAEKITLSAFKSTEGNIQSFMEKASHYQRLKGFASEEEAKFCLRSDLTDVIPELIDGVFISTRPHKPQ